MGLDEVVDEILEEGDRHASEIEKEAEEQAGKIVEEAEAEAEEIREEARAAADREGEELKRQELSSAKLESRMEEMQARKQLLSRAKEAAYDRLRNLSEDRRRAAVDSLLETANEELPEGQVCAAPADAGYVEDRVGDRYGGEIDAAAGIRIEEGGIVLDLTLDSMLEEKWEKELPEISDRLFGG